MFSNSKIVYSDNRFRIIADSYETEDLGNLGLQKIAKKYHLPCYDLYNEGGIALSQL